jgi:hypothetical protein
MQAATSSTLEWLAGPGPSGERGHLWPRWLFLRALGLIFLSAFYSLHFQIHGLIGPDGILPAGQYLELVAEHLGTKRFWYAPTLLWLGSGPAALNVVCWAGLLASILLVLNLWPRAALTVCLVTFLSFVSAAQDFSEYQSDGMLLAAGFLALFFAPPGLRPGLGAPHPPSRASRFLLEWLWFQIYFESGVVKLASHDPQWRHLTAIDHYYENGPLPDWIGWYAQQLPHGFHAGVALTTLIVELGLAWMLFLPRRFRLICFAIVTPFQIGIILSSNLAFLNYFVLALGFLLLDDRFVRGTFRRVSSKLEHRSLRIRSMTPDSGSPTPDASSSPVIRRSSLYLSLLFLGWIFYNTTALLLLLLFPRLPLSGAPIVALEPFRISNQYGLFAVMTTARYEIEFQGTRDGKTWVAYPFRYKPQDPRQAPRLYAPYQPRFDWNLWFASLGRWREYPFVVRTEESLLRNNSSVLSLFAANPFPGDPPRQVRAVFWQYWFTDLETKRREGLWWRREWRGLYAPTVELGPDGNTVVVEWPENSMQ